VITERRLAKVETSLPPKEAVLHWLAEAQQFASLVDYVRSIIDLPVSAAPLTRIGDSVEAAVRSAFKGEPRQAVESAVRRAVGDAVFLFVLVLKLNGAALEVARLEGLRAAAISLWVGRLLGDPAADHPKADERELERSRERLEGWRQWHRVLDAILTDVGAEEVARATLERRYFDDQRVLFSDATEAWASLREIVDRLVALAELNQIAMRAADSPTDERATDSLAAQVPDTAESRAAILADDARVTAFELLGDRSRAVAIMERRLRAEPMPAPISGSVRDRTNLASPD